MASNHMEKMLTSLSKSPSSEINSRIINVAWHWAAYLYSHQKSYAESLNPHTMMSENQPTGSDWLMSKEPS